MTIKSRGCVSVALAALMGLGVAVRAGASTYVVYLPMDSPIYAELDTLNGLGLLDTYLSEIKPISRVEAARLTLEAEQNLAASEQGNTLARSVLHALQAELSEEVGWLERNAEDRQPSMIHPLQRVEADYVFSSGKRRQMANNGGGFISAEEGTPLVNSNDDLPTSPGSNEVARWSGWAGAGGFLTAYGEGAVAGPLTHSPVEAAPQGNSPSDRARLLRGEVVGSLGNTALSFGYQEMGWGTGTYASLSQGDNAQPFPALRIQNIHPTYLPGPLRYLGPFRGEAFLGQLDHGRTFSRPWLSGQIVSFKPLPTFEFGLTHVIMFGGRGNDDYGAGGFLGRLTGLSAGNAAVANTNSRAGIYLKFYFPGLRNLQVYQETLGEDNLTTEIRPIGRFLPFLAVSYQGGAYLPRLTEDGLTTARFEYAIIEPNYSTHSDSLFWTYHNRLMGDPLGPDASRADLALGRWLAERYKTELDLFYTERAPRFGVAGLLKERSGGLALDLLSLPAVPSAFDGALGAFKTRVAAEYVSHINYSRNIGSLRIGLAISAALMPTRESFSWR